MKCEAGHAEFNPLCVECDRQLQAVDHSESNDEYFVVPPISKNHDGLTRLVVDSRSFMSWEIRDVLNEHTGLKWKVADTFLGKVCLATDGEVNEQFKVPYPRRGK